MPALNEGETCEKKMDASTESRDQVRRPPRRLTGLNGSMTTLAMCTRSEDNEQLQPLDDLENERGFYRKRVLHISGLVQIRDIIAFV